MANGPLGGNMGTPPVEPQPPQVSFETTAQSRGNFNNFLKSMPNTTAMTPIPPLGSAPMMPAPNPMSNIDIFNQPPSMGMGMMGMNQPQIQQPMQQPMMQSPMMGGLMGTPVQNFFFGGEAMDFEGFSDSSDPFGGGDSFNDSNDTSDPVVGDTFDRSTSDAFQSALDDINLGSDDNMFADDPAIVDRRGVNVGIENTGGFTTGVVPNLRGERFTRFETPDYALRALGRDFRTKVNKNPIENLMQGKDPYLTVGDYFETFTPSSENPGGTGNRVAEFTKATGKGANDILSLNDMNNIMDIQAKYEAGIRGVDPGRIEKIATTVPMNNDKNIATVLAGLDLKNALALDNKRKSFVESQPEGALKNTFFDYVPDAFQISNFINQKGSQTPTGVAPVGTQGAGSRGDTIQVQDSNVIGSTDAELAALNRAIANTQIVTDREKQLANVNNQTLADRLQLQRGLDKPLDTTTSDTALETMAGRRDILPDTRYDIDTSFIDRNFVGDDFQPALDFIDNREPDLDALRSDRATYDTIYDPETYTGPDIKSYGTKIGGTVSGEELDQDESIRTMSPGESRARFGGGLGEIVSGLEDGFQKDIVELANRKPSINVSGILGKALNLPETFSRDRMVDTLTTNRGKRLFGGTYEPTPIYQDGRIVGVRDQYGNLMEGRDPFAPDTGSNENEDPLILRPIAKAKEEEKEKEDKPPNIIGGFPQPPEVEPGPGLPILTPPKSVVVDSPFTSNVPEVVPSSFNTGDINKLIAMLTGIPAPKSMKQGGVAEFQNGGRVDQALDRFLATA